MSDPVKIAAVQMVTSTNLEANLQSADQLIREAAVGGAVMVALPENFALMPVDEQENVRRREMPGDGPIQDFVSDSAQRHGVWILAGTIPLQADAGDRYRAASILYDDRGTQVARYDKVHLFDASVADGRGTYRESRTVEPGQQVVVVDTPAGRLGLSVCYDVRFPELYRRMSAEGAEIVSIPSAFTAVTGRAHWKVLLRARAVENQVYVLAPAQGGHHENGRDTHGDTLIVDPWGRVQDCHPLGPGIATGVVDIEALRRIRQSFPCLAHRQPWIGT